MYDETLKKMINNALFKKKMIKEDFARYFVLAMLAGAYIGIAMFFIFAIAAPFHEVGAPGAKALLGGTFAVGLTLVVFAGAELFTGTTMYMTIGKLSGETTFKDMFTVWGVCFLGNLAGSLLLAFILKMTGLLDNPTTAEYITEYVGGKMNATPVQLFFKGLLCNVMVCLALWMCARTKEDTAKLILIFWCLFVFVGSGFEHSVANMSFMAMGLFVDYTEALAENLSRISWLLYVKNLVFVTLGNIVGGGLCVGGVYWFVSGSKKHMLNQ